LHLPAGFVPEIDRTAIEAHRLAEERFAAARIVAPAI